MRIQHNLAAMNSLSNYAGNNSKLSGNLEKLSSGYQINSAADNAAGLAISEKMRSQIAGLEKAQDNCNDGISLVQTAEGALTEVNSMLTRLTELATQSANGTYEDGVDRANIQEETDALLSEIDRISQSTNFNGINLLDGSLGGGATSASGTVFTGANVTKSAAATVDLAALDDFSGTTATVDTFDVDGQSLTIDWSKDEAAKVFGALNTDLSSATAEQTKDIANKLTDLFNNEMKAQGLTGSVKFTSSGAGSITAESINKDVNSSIGFIGTDSDDAANESIGAILFGSTAGESKITEGDEIYNGDTLAGNATTESFNMIINGKSVNVASPAVTKGTTTMAAAATALQTAIQTAVGNYNTELGLTAGTKDSASGLTGLTASDFTVDVKDGAFQIKYGGDEDVTFSFTDIGDRTTAATLGLANGSSLAGGNQGLVLQVGDTNKSYQKVTVSIADMSSNGLGLHGLDLSTQDAAGNAITTIKDAVNTVSKQRGQLGALQNRLDHTL
ncbi:MAG: hypothetical protein ACI4VM_01195, partial [Anaerovoracaceae bacterium]